MTPDSGSLIKLVTSQMPFGRYQGRNLYTLPVSYLEWFSREGFPDGQLGQLLSSLYEIKINGLESLLDPVIDVCRKEGLIP